MVIHSCVCHSSCRTGVKRSKRHDSSQVRRSNTICGSAHIHKQEQREASRPIIRRNPVSRSFFCQCESTAVPLRSRASETFLAVDFVKTIQRFRLRLPIAYSTKLWSWRRDFLRNGQAEYNRPRSRCSEEGWCLFYPNSEQI